MATGSSLTAVPGGDADIPAAYPCREPPGRDCLPVPPAPAPPPPPLPPRCGRCLIPSSRRTRRMLAGRSSTPQSTKMRHSGQRSSLLELTMFSRQRRQKVCWHGSTLAVVSRRSRHTEHSNRSKSDEESSMSVERVSIWAGVSEQMPRRLFLPHSEIVEVTRGRRTFWEVNPVGRSPQTHRDHLHPSARFSLFVSLLRLLQRVCGSRWFPAGLPPPPLTSSCAESGEVTLSSSSPSSSSPARPSQLRCALTNHRKRKMSSAASHL